MTFQSLLVLWLVAYFRYIMKSDSEYPITVATVSYERVPSLMTGMFWLVAMCHMGVKERTS